MKKWVNPDIMELGIGRTECEETGIELIDSASHFCHALDVEHINKGCNASGQGDGEIVHTHNNPCKVDDHLWNNSKKSSCCCYVPIS